MLTEEDVARTLAIWTGIPLITIVGLLVLTVLVLGSFDAAVRANAAIGGSTNGLVHLSAAAGRLGMNQNEFDTCLDSGRHTEQVQKDMAEGSRVGITGTPAIFVNGIPIEGGAVPFAEVAEAIDRELATTTR